MTDDVCRFCGGVAVQPRRRVHLMPAGWAHHACWDSDRQGRSVEPAPGQPGDAAAVLDEVLAAIGTYDPLMFSDRHRELFERAATAGARAAGSDEVIERAARAASIAWENADDGPDEWFAVARAVLAAVQPAPSVPAGADVAEVLAGLVENHYGAGDLYVNEQLMTQARVLVEAAQATTGARAAGSSGDVRDEIAVGLLEANEELGEAQCQIAMAAGLLASSSAVQIVARVKELSAAPPAPVAPGVAELLAECEKRQKNAGWLAGMASMRCDEIVRLLAPGGGQS